MFRVIKYFTDLQDNGQIYRTGDEYPRPGISVSESRIEELATGKNRRGFPLIKQMSTDITDTPAKNDEEGPKKAVSEAEAKLAEDLPQKPKTRRRTKKAAE